MKKKVLPSIHISLQDQSGSVAWVWYMYFSWLVDNIEKNAEDIVALDEELDTKVDKTDQAERLYGTDENGDQTTYDIDSLIPDVNLDNVTIDKNSSDQLQAIGTKNKNTASGATANIYDWVGTLAEYNAQNIATTHPEWLCFITDDVNPDTTYTKAEADALFVRKTGNYSEEANGQKNWTSNVLIKYRKTAPSTNTTKDAIIDDAYIYANANTSNKADGMYIVRRQGTDGYRWVVYGSSFRTGADDATKYTELHLGIRQDDSRFARVSSDDMAVGTNTTDIVTTRHLIRVLATIYPVGSLYIGTQSSCPMAQFFGTWTLVATDRALWGGNGSNGNSTINAGLPNITGSIGQNGLGKSDGSTTGVSGALYWNTNQTFGSFGSAGNTAIRGREIMFSASCSNSIYGNSSTVQPNAYRINVWRRTA